MLGVKKMIFYINNYYEESYPTNREPIVSLASNNKIRYFLYLLNEGNYSFKNISFGFTKTFGLNRKLEYQNMIYLPCLNFSEKNKYSFVSIIYTIIVLIIFIFRNVDKNDTIVLYHHPWILPVFMLTKSFKKYRLVLEIEELCFTDSSKSRIKSMIYRHFEKRIIQLSDHYIVVNDILKRYLKDNFIKYKSKQVIVCYGNYNLANLYKNLLNCNKPRGENTAILYSGSIDKVRGVYDAIAAFECLEDIGYTLYISGYGRENEIQELKKRILDIDKGKNKINFLGELSENEYLKLLSTVDICLNCQKDDDEFSHYSFPSKIINYLSFGKYVISSSMESVKHSKIEPYINFYKTNDTSSLVDLIHRFNRKEIDIAKNIDIAKFIRQLDKEMALNFGGLMKGENDDNS